MPTIVKSKPRTARQPQRNAVRPTPLQFRSEYGLTRSALARLTGLSERTLATWESADAVGKPAERAIKAAERLLKALARVIRKRAIAKWLDTPNSGFRRLKPIEVIERGEADQIWRMIYFLGSGTAS